MTSAVKFLSFRATSFDAINSEKANNISDVQNLDVNSLITKKDNSVEHIKDEISKSERPELTSARFVKTLSFLYFKIIKEFMINIV